MQHQQNISSLSVSTPRAEWSTVMMRKMRRMIIKLVGF